MFLLYQLIRIYDSMKSRIIYLSSVLVQYVAQLNDTSMEVKMRKNLKREILFRDDDRIYCKYFIRRFSVFRYKSISNRQQHHCHTVLASQTCLFVRNSNSHFL